MNYIVFQNGWLLEARYREQKWIKGIEKFANQGSLRYATNGTMIDHSLSTGYFREWQLLPDMPFPASQGRAGNAEISPSGLVSTACCHHGSHQV